MGINTLHNVAIMNTLMSWIDSLYCMCNHTVFIHVYFGVVVCLTKFRDIFPFYIATVNSVKGNNAITYNLTLIYGAISVMPCMYISAGCQDSQHAIWHVVCSTDYFYSHVVLVSECSVCWHLYLSIVITDKNCSLTFFCTTVKAYMQT